MCPPYQGQFWPPGPHPQGPFSFYFGEGGIWPPSPVWFWTPSPGPILFIWGRGTWPPSPGQLWPRGLDVLFWGGAHNPPPLAPRGPGDLIPQGHL